LDSKTNIPMDGFPVITETGISDDHSPLRTLSVGPVAHSDSEGRFLSTFFTQGLSIPREIEVNMEFGHGIWRSCLVRVRVDMVRIEVEHNVSIDLGEIRVDFDKCHSPTGV
jgi:hypothetical protein